MIWEWVPGISCGEFLLGQPFNLQGYSTRIELLSPSCEGADWETYRVGDEEARLRVFEGVLVGIECVDSLLFNGAEILGCSIERVQAILGSKPAVRQTWSDGAEMLEVEKLGLTLWLESGLVESATVEVIDNSE